VNFLLAASCPGKGGAVYKARFEKKHRYVKVIFKPAPEHSEASIFWQGDLNKDNKPDLIIRYLSGCDETYTCPFEILAACGNKRYRSIWGPSRVTEMEVVKRLRKKKKKKKAGKWKVIKAITSTRFSNFRETLYFKNGKYQGD
jgi:hypothetical protein